MAQVAEYNEKTLPFLPDEDLLLIDQFALRMARLLPDDPVQGEYILAVVAEIYGNLCRARSGETIPAH